MKRYAIFLGLLTLFFLVLFSESDLEEIETRLVKAVGKERIELLSELTNAYQNKEPKKTMAYGREALKLLRRFPDRELEMIILNHMSTASKELSEIYETRGDHRKAVDYYKKYKEIDEIIFNQMSRKKMVEVQALYETDRKEKELALLKKDSQLQQLELEQQGNIRRSFILIALLIVLSVFVIYTRYRLKTRAARALGKEIDQHKQTAQQLGESEEKFRLLAETSVVGICISQDHVIKYVNPAFLKVFAYPLEEIIGQGPLKLVIEEDRALVEDAMDFTDCEFRGLTKEGKVLHLESYRVQTLYHDQPAVLETIIDITDRKEIEAELLKMRKLESVGTLAGGIAHDFNKLLSVITRSAEKLKEDVQHTPFLHQIVERIEQTSLKAVDLTQKLITFSEGGESAPREVTLSSILKTTIDTYPKLQKPIHGISIPTDLKPIYGDERELSQVVGNLLWNAEEAKKDNEEVTVTIAAQNAILSPGNNYSLEAGEYINVSVTDNGKGISSAQFEKVFDPYFSTKDMGTQKGMGLGLAICYSIIKKHNGHISIKSEIGKGTTVELLLPAYLENG